MGKLTCGLSSGAMEKRISSTRAPLVLQDVMEETCFTAFPPGISVIHMYGLRQFGIQMSLDAT